MADANTPSSEWDLESINFMTPSDFGGSNERGKVPEIQPSAVTGSLGQTLTGAGSIPRGQTNIVQHRANDGQQGYNQDNDNRTHQRHNIRLLNEDDIQTQAYKAQARYSSFAERMRIQPDPGVIGEPLRTRQANSNRHETQNAIRPTLDLPGNIAGTSRNGNLVLPGNLAGPSQAGNSVLSGNLTGPSRTGNSILPGNMAEPNRNGNWQLPSRPQPSRPALPSMTPVPPPHSTPAQPPMAHLPPRQTTLPFDTATVSKLRSPMGPNETGGFKFSEARATRSPALPRPVHQAPSQAGSSQSLVNPRPPTTQTLADPSSYHAWYPSQLDGCRSQNGMQPVPQGPGSGTPSGGHQNGMQMLPRGSWIGTSTGMRKAPQEAWNGSPYDELHSDMQMLPQGLLDEPHNGTGYVPQSLLNRGSSGVAQVPQGSWNGPLNNGLQNGMQMLPQGALDSAPSGAGHVPQGPLNDNHNRIGKMTEGPPNVIPNGIPAIFQWLQQVGANGMSPNYRGNRSLAANMSANIPDDENCSLWITNLPSDCDHAMLLGAVRNCGKVFQTVINEPELARNNPTSAAKLIFFHHGPAATLMRQSREGRFQVGDRYPHVIWNRTRVPGKANSPESRVLQISGPREIVNFKNLTELFNAACTYQLESVDEVSRPSGPHEMTWRFGSFRCQAEACYKALRLHRDRYIHEYGSDDRMRRLWESVQVHYGVDPCA